MQFLNIYKYNRPTVVKGNSAIIEPRREKHDTKHRKDIGKMNGDKEETEWWEDGNGDVLKCICASSARWYKEWRRDPVDFETWRG